MTQHAQGDASCMPEAVDRLRAAVQQQRPELLGWFDQTLQMELRGFASSTAYISALDRLVRGLQKAGAGGVIKSAMSMKACPSAYMTAVRLNNIVPG